MTDTDINFMTAVDTRAKRIRSIGCFLRGSHAGSS